MAVPGKRHQGSGDSVDEMLGRYADPPVLILKLPASARRCSESRQMHSAAAKRTGQVGVRSGRRGWWIPPRAIR